jgi:flagella basal body P-ring formation protein FlgA
MPLTETRLIGIHQRGRGTMNQSMFVMIRLGIAAGTVLFATAVFAQSQAPGGIGSTRAPQIATIQGLPPPAPSPSGIAREALRDQARDWMAGQTGTDSALIRVGGLDGRVDPPSCDNGYRFDFPFESRSTIRAACDNPVRQYYLRASVERTRQRVVITRPMAAGEILTPTDLAVRDFAGGTNGFDNPAQVVGRSLRRAIASGEAPQSSDLEEVVSVVRTSSDLRAGQPLSANALRAELLPRSKVPAGAVTRIDEASKTRLKRDVSADHLLLTDDLVSTRPVVIAKRNLMRGETIDASALEIVEMDSRGVPADHLSSPQGLEQGEITGMVRAGEPLRASMVKPAIMVRKGQTVLLSVARSGIEINVQVEALEDAKLGDQIKLRNPDSGKALAGLVTGRGTARAL